MKLRVRAFAPLGSGLKAMWPRLIAGLVLFAALALLLYNYESVAFWEKPAARHRHMATRLRVRQDYAGAAQQYREALRDDPRDRLAAHGLIVSLVQAGRYEEAAEACRRWLASERRDAEAEGWLAYLAGVLGHNEEALAAAQRAVSLEPDDAHARLALGDALWRAGRRGSARDQWSAVTRMSSLEAAAAARERLRRGGG